MPKHRIYLVNFRKVGSFGPIAWYFEAPDVASLEPQIQTFVDNTIGEDKHAEVTLEPLAMKGQINYGLLGDFTIIDTAEEQAQ